MEIEMVSIGSLISYQLNNKIHTETQIDRIACSIQQFGFNQPIVIDEHSIILAGKGRYEAAKKLGLAWVPVYRREDLTEAQKKAYRIVDNKTASDTGYDYSNLELEIKALEELKFDFEPFAFDEFKLPTEEDFEDTPDDTPDDTSDDEQIGQIKLKVPMEDIDHFEVDLDNLLRKYDRVTKETKRSK